MIGKVQEILDRLKGSAQECPHDALTELKMHFNEDTHAKTKVKIESMCNMRSMETLPWERVTGRGERFDETYFAGGGPWNLQVETSHYGESMYVLQEDAKRVKKVYQSFAQLESISWPEHVEFLADCPLRAVTCCQTGDRQANDNNGNCQKPYDQNCINKVPADNTQVCSVNGTKDLPFLGEGQQAMHCHSFTWSSNKQDPSYVFRGNKLFYTSMYDHLLQRGYVKNIPGAPMCGCAERMPVVTRSDCTQVDVGTTFRFEPSAPGASAEILLNSRDIDFNACQGADNSNNDLYSYYKRLVLEGRATLEELVKLRKFVLGGNYDNAICSDGDSDNDKILAQLAGNSKDASLVTKAILDFEAKERGSFPGMQNGGYYMLMYDARRFSAYYLGESLGLQDEALVEYLDKHFLDVWNKRAHPRNIHHFVKVSELSEFMRDLESPSRRLLVV